MISVEVIRPVLGCRSCSEMMARAGALMNQNGAPVMLACTGEADVGNIG